MTPSQLAAIRDEIERALAECSNETELVYLEQETVRSAVEALRGMGRDAERLDWLDAHRSGKQHIRPLIDAAMSEKPEKP